MASGSAARREGHDHLGPWVLEWFCEADTPPLPHEIIARLSVQGNLHDVPINLKDADLIIEELAEENWLEKAYQEHAPFSVGPFYIYGSHIETPVPEGQIGLLIDAVTAFGSGDHGTTKGCLQAMLYLKGKGVCPWNILDMGTGSGILSIAAHKLWNTPITAVDIEEESVRVAEKYRDLNQVPADKTGMICAAGDGFKTEIVQARKPYELIIANILAGPLREMAPDLEAVLDTPGYVILSGMLTTQADEIRATYEALGLALKNRSDIGKWTTLVFQKS